ALAVLRDDVAVREERARVVDDLALILGVTEIQRDARDARPHALERRFDAFSQAPVQQQILGRIARQRELRERDEFAAERIARVRRGLEHLTRVLVDAADAGVELRERDFHGEKGSDTKKVSDTIFRSS